MTKGHNNEVYVVFGAAGYIGEVLCTKFLNEWKDVQLIAVDNDQSKLDKLKSEAGKNIVGTYCCDVTNLEQVNKVFDQIAKDTDPKKLAGIVNLVGNVSWKPLLETTPEDFTHVLQVNLMSAFNILRRGLQDLEKSEAPVKGVVLMSAAVAEHGIKHHEAWAAAKAAISGLVRTSAATCAPKGICVNAVAPGLSEAAAEQQMPEPVQEEVGKLYPLYKRFAKPEEIASAIEFMMCPHRSSYISGQVLAVDAGLSCAAPHDSS